MFTFINLKILFCFTYILFCRLFCLYYYFSKTQMRSLFFTDIASTAAKYS